MVVKGHVHPRGRIVEQEPARLRKLEAVGLGIHQHDTAGEAGFEKDLRRIDGDIRLFGRLFHGQPPVRIAQGFEDAEFQQEAASLEDDGTESDELGQALGLPGTELFPCIDGQGRSKMHKIVQVIVI